MTMVPDCVERRPRALQEIHRSTLSFKKKIKRDGKMQYPSDSIYTISSRYAAAKSLQSCLTLCDPTDCSPPGSSVHGIFQARALEWVPVPSLSSRYNRPQFQR